MEAMEAILSRRSIRKYTGEAVDDDLVKGMLEAAMAAPSAGNQQCWQYVVITDSEILNEIPSIHPSATMVREAALAVLICGDKNLEKHTGYWVQDCAASTENLLLAAHALGLGACWLGVHPREDRVKGLKALLKLPEQVMPLALVAVGHPDETRPRANRYNPQRVHKNGW
jgi:nitroreductase